LEAAIVIAVLLSLVEAIVSNNPNPGSPTDSTNGVDEKEKDPENPEPNPEPNSEPKVDEVNMDQAAFVKKLRLQVRLWVSRPRVWVLLSWPLPSSRSLPGLDVVSLSPLLCECPLTPSSGHYSPSFSGAAFIAIVRKGYRTLFSILTSL
jgi:hypothetical protein